MLVVKDIMTRDVLTLAPDQSLRDAMEVLTSRHITGAPVAAQGRIVGVVSLTDLAEYAASSPGVPTERPELAEWGEFDSPSEWPAGEEPPAEFFAALWDDAGAETTERFSTTDSPEWNSLEEHTVAEVMNRKLAWLRPETPVEYAADFMRDAGIHRVLIMEDDQLLGLLTTTDIAGAVADNRLTKRVYVFDRQRGDAP